MPNYPELTFGTTSLDHTGDDRYTVTGDLSSKGTTKSVSVDFEFNESVKRCSALIFESRAVRAFRTGVTGAPRSRPCRWVMVEPRGGDPAVVAGQTRR